MSRYLYNISLCVFLLSGCMKSEDSLKGFAIQLSKSENITAEYKNAVNLNDLANDLGLSYSVEVTSSIDHKKIDISQVLNHKSSRFFVQISSDIEHWSVTWSPIDKNNILLLLRE